MPSKKEDGDEKSVLPSELIYLILPHFMKQEGLAVLSTHFKVYAGSVILFFLHVGELSL